MLLINLQILLKMKLGIMDNNINKIHFIGIGGVGMSGIASVASKQGFEVSGSDLRQSYLTDMLASQGIKIYIGQTAKNIEDAKPDLVIISTAILENNPELIAAKDSKVKIWHRAQMLSYLGRKLKTLAVAGTHGKTSTSSMLASVMDGIGANPTFLIGGIVRKYKTNAVCGSGDYYVVEADESDKSFTYLNPFASIVTNIEADHLDHYSGLDEIYDKFSAFIGSLPKDGFCVACGDDPKVVSVSKKATGNVISYGFDKSCDCVISDYQTQGIRSTFKLHLPILSSTLSVRDSELVVDCSLKQNPGKHYASNAASVLVMLDALGFDVVQCAKVLSDFAGIKRRFDLIGEVNGITVVDDYAHHSTEIRSTVEAACNLNFNKVHVVWQPHRYSRYELLTQVYRDEFAHAFDGADNVIFASVYAAGEAPRPGVNAKAFMQPLVDQATDSSPNFYCFEDNSDILDFIEKNASSGDLVITMGAGDVTTLAPRILDRIK